MNVVMPRARAIFALACAGALAALTGCSRTDYPQATPEETIASASQMVEAGNAEKLPNLVYADNPDMRRLLNTLGRATGNLEELAKEINTRYPEETAALAKKAEEAAKQGKSTSLIGQLAQQSRRQGQGGRRNRGARSNERPGERQERRDQFDDAITRVFADPYAFLRDNQGRLTTAYLTDDSVALLWDNKPVLQPIGMVMRKADDGKWYFVLPTSAPGISNFMPQTPEQYQLMGQMVAVFDKVVVDLREEVVSGRHPTLESVSRRAGEMTFLPAVLTFYAYSQLREQQQRTAGGN
jgi:hypothetical protein